MCAGHNIPSNPWHRFILFYLSVSVFYILGNTQTMASADGSSDREPLIEYIKKIYLLNIWPYEWIGAKETIGDSALAPPYRTYEYLGPFWCNCGTAWFIVGRCWFDRLALVSRWTQQQNVMHISKSIFCFCYQPLPPDSCFS